MSQKILARRASVMFGHRVRVLPGCKASMSVSIRQHLESMNMDLWFLFSSLNLKYRLKYIWRKIETGRKV